MSNIKKISSIEKEKFLRLVLETRRDLKLNSYMEAITFIINTSGFEPKIIARYISMDLKEEIKKEAENLGLLKSKRKIINIFDLFKESKNDSKNFQS